MTASPYDDYPYPDPSRYPVDQLKNLRLDTAPRRDTWEQWFPGEAPAPKRVLVVGCGVFEAIAVAAQEPLLEVRGIDSSQKVIELAIGLADKGGIKNVHFALDDVIKLSPDSYGRFDLVCASGVLHHVRESSLFVRGIQEVLVPGGLFSVMVYGDQYREFVMPFCHMLRMLGIERNAHGIAFVRGLIANLPSHHPVKAFNALVSDYDAQIADLWLHPYFTQYRADELLRLMESNGLTFRRWIEPLAVDYSIFENLPSEFADVKDRFARMTFREKCRVGQIYSHADIKLSAVFAI